LTVNFYFERVRMVDSHRSILAKLRREWDLNHGFDRNLGSSLRSDFFRAHLSISVALVAVVPAGRAAH
jgi:hypothetical protein